MKTKLSGFDEYLLYCHDVVYYLDLLQHHQIKINHLVKVDHFTYTFRVRKKDSYKIRKLELPVKYIKSIGWLYYYTLLLKNYIKLSGLLIFTISIMFLQTRILDIHVIGTKQELNTSIISYLNEKNIYFLQPKLTVTQMDALAVEIQNSFDQKIDWLNIYLKGNTLSVEYTNKQSSVVQTSDLRAIIACKDSVIKQFNIQSGQIVTQLNQFVKKDEVLVTNALVSTFDQTILLYPKGEVWGYTWYEIEQEVVSNDQAEGFSLLLQQSRHSLEQLISKNAKIDHEKVLQFTINDSTMKMKVHYTVIENIACKGDFDE